MKGKTSKDELESEFSNPNFEFFQPNPIKYNNNTIYPQKSKKRNPKIFLQVFQIPKFPKKKERRRTHKIVF